MTITVPASVEEQLRDLAAKQGREMSTVVEDALRQYLELTSITDLEAADVGETQLRLVNELPHAPAWNPREA
jgi:predicted transcriptional regulator